jgi:hemoglobin
MPHVGRARGGALGSQKEGVVTPFELLGADRVREIAARFYDHMDAHEPALAALHPVDAQGRVESSARERFALFLIGWWGGPADYERLFGHPRLRMRHARVPVDLAMRDAWLRCMRAALDEAGVDGELRLALDARFADVADFLRNAPG